MRAKALEIAWHDKVSPIFSVDISCHRRLLSAGGDKVIRVWQLHDNPILTLTPSSNQVTKPKEPSASTSSTPQSVEWLADLNAHTTTPNVARFSRDGYRIATGADGGEIVIWRLSSTPVDTTPRLGEDSSSLPRERWLREKTLRAHVQDVLHLAWSADGTKLVSASVDNAVMIWDLRDENAANKLPVSLRQHSNFVQGVAIDPYARLVTSLGNDRALRVFTISNAGNWCQVAAASSAGDNKLFAPDGRFLSCFRRLDWSPDGSVLACPSGLHLPSPDRRFAVHLFARNRWSAPVAQAGGLEKPACAVRFSPVLYQLRDEKADSTENGTSQAKESRNPFAQFSYRMIFAVVCQESTLFYDTQSFNRPFAVVEGLHCAEQTDIAWSQDGLTAAVSSLDGYVSLICFTNEELGKPLDPANTPNWLNLHKEIHLPLVHRTPPKPKKPSSPGKTQPVNSISIVEARPFPRKINFAAKSQPKKCLQTTPVKENQSNVVAVPTTSHKVHDKTETDRKSQSTHNGTTSPPPDKQLVDDEHVDKNKPPITSVSKKGPNNHRVVGPKPLAMESTKNCNELDKVPKPAEHVLPTKPCLETKDSATQSASNEVASPPSKKSALQQSPQVEKTPQQSPEEKELKVVTPKSNSKPAAKVQTTLFGLKRNTIAATTPQKRSLSQLSSSKPSSSPVQTSGPPGDKRRLKERSIEEQRKLGVFDDEPVPTSKETLPITSTDLSPGGSSPKRQKVGTIM